ncbi:MAG: hypothetical protein ACOCOX_06805, partial [Segatella copri]
PSTRTPNTNGASLLFLIITTLFYTIQLFFCKEIANERNESWLSNCRVQLFFCKEIANERNESWLSNCRVQLFFCKDSQKKQIKQGCFKQSCLKPSFFCRNSDSSSDKNIVS